MSTMRYLGYYYKVIQSFFLSVLLELNVKVVTLGESIKTCCKTGYHNLMRMIFRDNIVYFAVYTSGKYHVVYDYAKFQYMLYFMMLSLIKSISGSFADMETIKITGSINKNETYYILKRFTDKGLETDVVSSSTANAIDAVDPKSNILFVLVNNEELYTKQIKEFRKFLHMNNNMTAREFIKMVDCYVSVKSEKHTTRHVVSIITVTIVIIDHDNIFQELVFKGEDIINIS